MLSDHMKDAVLRVFLCKCPSSRFLLCSSGLLTAPFVSGRVLLIQNQSSADESRDDVNFSQELQPGIHVIAIEDVCL